MHPQSEKIINGTYYEQRSPEWFDQRMRMITASEAGSALGINKYQTKRSYILEKSGISPRREFGNAAMQHGIDSEDMVREWYENKYDQKVHEVGCVEHTEHTFIGASPDGVCESGRLVEIKCPSGKNRIKKEVGKIIPLSYLCQVQLQLECCDMEECDFVQFVAPQFSEDGEPHFYIDVIKRDREWFADALPKLREVFDIVLKIRENPENTSLLYETEINLADPTKCDIRYDESDFDSC